jgi:pseudouridine-5'-phosphate glycosidase
MMILNISPEVQSALLDRRAVVALESTIIAHGMPYPQNVATALKVEQEVRNTGAIPATIAILNGQMKVGLSPSEIEYLGEKGPKVGKASRRDMPVLMARGEDGATTVAATMIIAAKAGIRVFATGGIGGVHRGAAQSMDISADLQELARTDVAVVCAGAKSILDLTLTLEYLETMGVPVLGYQTDEFPAFYTRESGLFVDYRVDDVAELANIIKLKWQAALHGGLVVANPIPEQYALPARQLDAHIKEAIAEAEARQIAGKALTPFLLDKVKQLTKGHSLDANIQLVLNNARLAGQLSKALVNS